MGSDSKYGPMTPVPRSFLNSISEDLGEIKPQVKATNDALIALNGEMKSTKGRVKKLEDHIPCEAVAEVRSDAKGLTLKVNTVETKLNKQDEDVADIKTKDSKRIYWILAAAIVVAGSVAGWLTTMATMETNVNTLQDEQTKIRGELSGLRSATYIQTAQVKQATTAVNNAATEVKNGKHKQPTVVEWYRALPDREKRLLRKREILPFDEVEVDMASAKAVAWE